MQSFIMCSRNYSTKQLTGYLLRGAHDVTSRSAYRVGRDHLENIRSEQWDAMKIGIAIVPDGRHAQKGIMDPLIYIT